MLHPCSSDTGTQHGSLGLWARLWRLVLCFQFGLFTSPTLAVFDSTDVPDSVDYQANNNLFSHKAPLNRESTRNGIAVRWIAGRHWTGRAAKIGVAVRWAPGHRWMGKLGAGYDRSLVGFNNAGFTTPASATPAPDDKFESFVSETIFYDDNVFRLSKDIVNHLHTILGPLLNRDDYINRVSGGAHIHYPFGRQFFDANFQIDDNRFAHNPSLNHTSVKGVAAMRWVMGHRWTGKFGADYSQSMIGFANSSFYGKTSFYGLDLLKTTGQFVDIRFQLNPRWAVFGGIRWSDIAHSATQRAIYDFHSTSNNVGLSYQTPVGNSLGVESQHTDAQYLHGQSLLLSLQDAAYAENSTNLLIKYRFGEKNQLESSVGYMERKHPRFGFRNFAGEVWRTDLVLAPTAKAKIAVSSWRQLNAYADLDSSYYVSEGYSVTPTLALTAKTQLSAKLSEETRNFTGNAAVDSFGLSQRKDTVRSFQLIATYAPLRFSDLALTYSHDIRKSNRQFFSYVDNSLSATVTLKF